MDEKLADISKECWRYRLPAIFAHCVAEETTRYSFAYPWRDGMDVWATNGRILIRMPYTSTLGPLVDRSSQMPDVLSVWGGEFLTDSLPIPAFPEVFGVCESIKCLCVRRNMADEDCVACAGEGMVHGEPRYRVVVWDRVSLSERWVRPILLGGGEIFPRRTADSAKQSVRFTMPGGIEGRLMPCDLDPSNVLPALHIDMRSRSAKAKVPS